MMLESLAESLNMALLPRPYQELANDKRQKLESSVVTMSQIVQKEKSKDVAFKAIEAILLEEIDLAKPDDLPYLESQVPRIAGRIAYRLCSRDDLSG